MFILLRADRVSAPRTPDSGKKLISLPCCREIFRLRSRRAVRWVVVSGCFLASLLLLGLGHARDAQQSTGLAPGVGRSDG